MGNSFPQFTRYYLYTKDFDINQLKNHYHNILCFPFKKNIKTIETIKNSINKYGSPEFPNLEIKENVTEEIFENKSLFDIFTFTKEQLKKAKEISCLIVYIEDLDILVGWAYKYRRFYILETLLDIFQINILVYKKGDLKNLEKYKDQFVKIIELPELPELSSLNFKMLYIWPNQIEEKDLDKIIEITKPKNIYYDLSDAWWYFWPNEKDILKKCTLITCSSKYLYNVVKNEIKVKCYYVPNGNNNFIKDPDIPKKDIKLAIYPGNFIKDKVDIKLLNLLIEKNPDWYFLFFCNSSSYLNFRNSLNKEYLETRVWVNLNLEEDMLFRVLEICTLGLIPLMENSEWTKGMLPNKLFNFINAEIPTIYSGGADENFEDYGEVCYKLQENDLNLNHYLKNIPTNIYKKYTRTWADVVENISQILRIGLKK